LFVTSCCFLVRFKHTGKKKTWTNFRFFKIDNLIYGCMNFFMLVLCSLGRFCQYWKVWHKMLKRSLGVDPFPHCQKILKYATKLSQTGYCVKKNCVFRCSQWVHLSKINPHPSSKISKFWKIKNFLEEFSQNPHKGHPHFRWCVILKIIISFCSIPISTHWDIMLY